MSTSEEPAWAPWWHAATTAGALLHAGRFAEADALVAEHYDRALAAGDDEARAVFAVLEPSAIADRGSRAPPPAGRGRRCSSTVSCSGPCSSAATWWPARWPDALSGDADTAAADLEALDDLELPAIRRDEADVGQARAWTAAAAGTSPALVTTSSRRSSPPRPAATSSARSPRCTPWPASAVRRTWSTDSRTWPLASTATSPPCGWRTQPRWWRATPQRSTPCRCGSTTWGPRCSRAEAAADAAVAHRRGGDRRAAAASARRAGDLATQAEDPVTPALQAVESRAALTPAERETALLAAGGRANKEIAEQLHLSPRTVENRLQRVYDKLGVGGRGELAGALAPTG